MVHVNTDCADEVSRNRCESGQGSLGDAGEQVATETRKKSGGHLVGGWKMAGLGR